VTDVTNNAPQLDNPWTHRTAVLLAWVTFPLIWVGGLVTTYDAGMAVPDWPGTYGYNLFLYPWQSWIAGPWDLFIEHGHRLLGALAGVLTMALVAVVYRWDTRRWMLHLSLFALAAVILQGCLGGARVLLDDRQLAMIHGCAGPAFFALCVAICVFSSRLWKQTPPGEPVATAGRLHGTAILIVCMAYLQLVLGAVLRHVSASASPSFFGLIVYGHLIGAGLLSGLIFFVAWEALRGAARHQALRWPAWSLLLLILIQLLLGCATWVVNYHWPSWIQDWDLVAVYTTVQAKGLVQTMIVTAHQATGSLVLGVSVLFLFRSMRVIRGAAVAPASRTKAYKGATA
jgi:cytochrome c oxidase assembly protein subunit 15